MTVNRAVDDLRWANCHRLVQRGRARGGATLEMLHYEEAFLSLRSNRKSLQKPNRWLSRHKSKNKEAKASAPMLGQRDPWGGAGAEAGTASGTAAPKGGRKHGRDRKAGPARTVSIYSDLLYSSSPNSMAGDAFLVLLLVSVTNLRVAPGRWDSGYFRVPRPLPLRRPLTSAPLGSPLGGGLRLRLPPRMHLRLRLRLRSQRRCSHWTAFDGAAGPAWANGTRAERTQGSSYFPCPGRFLNFGGQIGSSCRQVRDGQSG